MLRGALLGKHMSQRGIYGKTERFLTVLLATITASVGL